MATKCKIEFLTGVLKGLIITTIKYDVKVGDIRSQVFGGKYKVLEVLEA
jgi:hypothetical protein